MLISPLILAFGLLLPCPRYVTNTLPVTAAELEVALIGMLRGTGPPPEPPFPEPPPEALLLGLAPATAPPAGPPLAEPPLAASAMPVARAATTATTAMAPAPCPADSTLRV